MPVTVDSCQVIGNSALDSMDRMFGQGGGIYMLGVQTPGYVTEMDIVLS